MKSRNNNNDSLEPSNPGQDLDWLAFCYIADELDAATKAEFELRLQTDVEACEAVASAVQLSSLVCEACEEPEALELVEVAADDNRGWSLAPALVFAASILLCLFAAGWVWNSGNSGGDDSFELASTWAESLTEDAADSLQNVNESAIVLSSAETFDSPSDLDSDVSWMLVALADMEGNE